MDYAANSKMMEEEEQMEFLYPQGDTRLDKFIRFTKEQQLNSIYVGSIITEIGEEKYLRAKAGENKIEKDKLKQLYQLEIGELTEKVKRLESNRKEREREILTEKRELKENIRIEITDTLTSRYNDTITELNTDVLTLKSRVEFLIDNKIEQQNEFHQKIINQKDEMERKLEEQRQKYEKKLEEYREKVEIITNVGVSSKKGQEGENWVFNELVRQFKSAQVEDCHTMGHKGDFTVTEGDMKGMFESKNYKRNVPKREIKKFREDIENNADLRYGIMLSLKSGIVNHNDFDLEFWGGKPIVYIVDVKEKPEKIKMAYKCCQMILKNIDCFDVTKEETQLKIKEAVKVMTARQKRLTCKLEDFSNDMKGELNQQWSDFELILNHINLTN